MDIDSEHLGIPETEYKTIIRMPSGEFKRIVSELSVLGDCIQISCSKEGVKVRAIKPAHQLTPTTTSQSRPLSVVFSFLWVVTSARATSFSALQTRPTRT